MRKVVLIVCLQFIFGFAQGQDWILVGKSSSGDTYYIRNSSTTSYEGKKVWVKRLADKITVKKNGKTLTYTNAYEVILYEFNCTGNQLKVHSGVTYNSKGTVVDSFNIPSYSTQWNDVVPESVGEMLLTKVCELF